MSDSFVMRLEHVEHDVVRVAPAAVAGSRDQRRMPSGAISVGGH
ncbi:hypothetical protein ACO2Q7_14470 [Rathayibacter sp. KR2-224]